MCAQNALELSRQSSQQVSEFYRTNETRNKREDTSKPFCLDAPVLNLELSREETGGQRPCQETCKSVCKVPRKSAAAQSMHASSECVTLSPRGDTCSWNVSSASSSCVQGQQILSGNHSLIEHPFWCSLPLHPATVSRNSSLFTLTSLSKRVFPSEALSPTPPKN